jgi:hypothetical protein
VGASVPALANVSAATVGLSRSAAGALSIYTVTFTTTVALVIDTDTITIVAPAGTVFPAAASAYTVNGTAPNVAPTVTPNQVIIKVHSAVPAGSVPVVITGATNPAAGPQTLTVQTSKETTPVTSGGYTNHGRDARHCRPRIHGVPSEGLIHDGAVHRPICRHDSLNRQLRHDHVERAGRHGVPASPG